MESSVDVAVLERAIGLAHEVLAGLDAGHMDAPTPCAEWRVRDLAGHLVGLTDFFADVFAFGDVAAHKVWPDYADSDFVDAFTFQARRLLRAVDERAGTTDLVRLPTGPARVELALNVAVGEMVVHTWDLGAATSQNVDVDDLAGVLLTSAWMEMCDAALDFEDPPFAASVLVSRDTSTTQVLVARLGRDPNFVGRTR